MPSHQRSALRRAWVAAGLVLLWLLSVDLPAAQAQATTGSWQLGPDLPFFPVHDHVLPDGKVMLWPGDQGINGDDPRTWDPATGTVTPLAKKRISNFRSLSSPPRLVNAISACTKSPRSTASINARSISSRSNRKIMISTDFLALRIPFTRRSTPWPG